MMRTRLSLQSGLTLTLLTAVTLTLPGCGGGSQDTTQTIVIDGSSTVYPISRAAYEMYQGEVEPNVKMTVNLSGTGGGFGKYNQGEVDIVDASRPAKPAEEEKANDQGYEWTQFTVGYDGITVVVHPENDWASVMTVEQLKSILDPESTITRWNEVDPSWPDQPIKLFTPDDDSGTFDFFTDAIIGEEGVQRMEGVQASSDDNVLVNGVAGDKNALGYFGFAYYNENTDKLKAVSIQDGDQDPVEPTLESIFAKEYTPLARPLFIYVKNAALDRPEVAKFVRYYLENVATFASDAGYVAPTDEEVQANLDALDAAEDASNPAE